MNIKLKTLIGKLNDAGRGALESAAALCFARTHYNVEVEHYLLRLLDAPDCDARRIFRYFGVDEVRLAAELGKSLDNLKTGNSRTPAFSPTLVRMLQQAWMVSSLEFEAPQLRTGHTVLALIADEELARMFRDVSGELSRISAEKLSAEFADIVAGSRENAVAVIAPRLTAVAAATQTPNLDLYTINVTENARSGKIDRVLGRDAEIRQVIDILMRRRQNNPILTGEAGVGKTAIMEGFALRIAHGDVPPSLRKVSVRALDLTLLQAGAGIKGEFENRLKNLIEEVKSSAVPIILFIDEAHTMIGAGGAAGQSDAANILKPALARGELRTVAATTWSEYKRYFERDAALARRFQVVKVEEPTEAQCLVMMRGVAAALEKHHGVRILGEAAEAAVRLSHRYLSGRQLPDKAVSVLDTACARISLSQNSLPAPLEDAERQLDDLASQERSLQRESAAGADHGELLAAVCRNKAQLQTSLTALRTRFDEVRKRVGKIRELRAQLENGAASTQAAASLRTELVRLNAELDKLQGDQPLLHVCVDSQLVSEIISQWTGIPVGNMLKDQLRAVLDLEGELAQRVVGQPDALQAIARRIRTSRARLEDPNKPVGAFLLVGPSGVGKTETALALADLLYGGERNLFSLSMSEFQEAHTVSVLKGAPPGYVGFDEGGILTEAVRRQPYSVVLLDEVEKAHPDVLELFIQVLDKGVMEDGKGREIDFRNIVVLLTSNAAVETVRTLFKPAFLNLLVMVPYAPVRDEALRKIVILKLGKIRERLHANHHIEFDWDDALVEHVALRSMEVEGGARNVDHILTNSMLPEISRQILERMADGGKVTAIRAGLNADGGFAFS